MGLLKGSEFLLLVILALKGLGLVFGSMNWEQRLLALV